MGPFLWPHLGVRAERDGGIGKPFLGRHAIEAHHRGEHQRVGEAVVRPGDWGQRVRDRVTRSEPFLEGDRPEGATEQHLLARLEVLAVVHGPLEVRGYPAQAVDGDGVRQRVLALGNVCLQIVRQRVHSRGGGDERRKPDRQLRIEERGPRHQVRRKDDGLGTVDHQHGAAAHLASGARRGRHLQDRRNASGDSRVAALGVVVLRKGRLVVHQQGDRLRHVERRASPEAEDAVGARRPIGFDAAQGVAIGRVRLELAEDLRLDPRLLEERRDEPEEPRLEDAFVRHQQRACGASALQLGRQLPDRSPSVEDPGRKAHHGCHVQPLR